MQNLLIISTYQKVGLKRLTIWARTATLVIDLILFLEIEEAYHLSEDCDVFQPEHWPPEQIEEAYHLSEDCDIPIIGFSVLHDWRGLPFERGLRQKFEYLGGYPVIEEAYHLSEDCDSATEFANMGPERLKRLTIWARTATFSSSLIFFYFIEEAYHLSEDCDILPLRRSFSVSLKRLTIWARTATLMFHRGIQLLPIEEAYHLSEDCDWFFQSYHQLWWYWRGLPFERGLRPISSPATASAILKRLTIWARTAT